MNSEAKQIWLKALRSNHYKQTYTAIRNDDGFCPLGVLVDCYLNNVACHLRWQVRHGKYCIPKLKYFSNYLPNDIGFWRWIGGLPWNMQVQITIMNDVQKTTFQEIANWIEKHL